MANTPRRRFSPLLIAATASVALAGALLVGCQDHELPTTVPVDESADVRADGTSGGNPGFFILPPIAPNPGQHENFDRYGFNAFVQPVVKICELTLEIPVPMPPDAPVPEMDTPCVSEDGNDVFVAEFAFAPGQVEVYPDEELYKVEWHTDLYDLNTARYYRIFVRAPTSTGELQLGFVDVNPVTAKEMKNAKTGEVFALKDGRTVPIKFRIEADWLCDPASDNCAAAVITASEGGTVTAGTDDEVYVPPQDGGFPVAGGGTVDQITVTVDVCLDEDTPDGYQRLPIDLPQGGNCLKVTAEPRLDPNPARPLPAPAIVAMCSAEYEVDPLPDLYTMHRWDEEVTGKVYALPHAYYECGSGPNPPANGALNDGSTGLVRLAKAGWRTLSDGFERLLPSPLMASRPVVMHHGPAAPTGFFSKFRLAYPATIEVVPGRDGQAAEVGSNVPLPPAVYVKNLMGEGVEGAVVWFDVVLGYGEISQVPVPTGSDGMAELEYWELGSNVGLNAVRAYGRGFADEENNGPRLEEIDPFQPLDDEFDDLAPGFYGEPVELFEGDVLITAGSVAEGALPSCDGITCSQGIISADEGGVVALGGDLVDFPSQGDEGFKVVNPDDPEGPPVTVENISVFVDECANPDALPVALPQYGPCLDIYTVPQLAAELAELATVAMCSLEGEDGSSFGLAAAQWNLVTMLRWDDRGSGNIYALSHYAYPCGSLVSNPADASGLVASAMRSVRAVRDKVASALAPTPLYANAPVVMHHGPAAPTGFFSRFRLALPAEMTYLDADDADRTAATGATLPTAVLVTDYDGNPVNGASVTFTVTAGNGAVGSSVITVESGSGDVASGVSEVPWTLGEVGHNEVTATAFGIAGPLDGGPFMPEQLNEPTIQQPVMLEEGSLAFTADATAEGYTCYPDLPDPVLAFLGTEDYSTSGGDFTRYRIAVTNWSSYPDDMFVLAPDWGPCGQNPSPSRTDVDIFDGTTDARLYGFCALNSADDLQRLWFARPQGTAPPASVYITMNDRACETVYTSNSVSITPPGAIFQATFTDDAVDQLPGTPEIGTWDWINEGSADGMASLRVRSSVGDLLDKPVELSMQDGHIGGVDLRGTVAGTPPTTGQYSVRWRSLVYTDGGARIELRDASLAVVAVLHYRAAGAFEFNGSSITGVGWTVGVSQQFEVIADLDTRTARALIDGVPVAAASFVSGSASSLARISLNVGGTAAQTVGWDDIVVLPYVP